MKGKRVHLIGIGGSGLSAIARLLKESGYQVTGSDRILSPLTQALQEEGIAVTIGHQAENVYGVDWVVRSSAIPDDNVEVRAALAANIPVLKRADFLGELMADRMGIAIAGTHGKTTTTAMIAWMLTALGQDPSYIIGGVAENLGSNAHAGKGLPFVIEADEYDGMFLGLRPRIGVVTNVEYDHPDCYPTVEEYFNAFSKFTKRLGRDDVLIACGDDLGAVRLLEEASRRGVQTYSYALTMHDCDYQAEHLQAEVGGCFSFGIMFRGQTLAEGQRVRLQVPGSHNALNALGAITVAHQLDLDLAPALQALGDFKGSERRFELAGETAGITVIDDYAHHPSEIRATLAAARSRYPDRQLWAVWQPHTYSRTRILRKEYLSVFQDCDRLVVTEIYPAREAPPADGFSARQVAAEINHPEITFIPELKKVGDYLLEKLMPGDVLLVLSAGDAYLISTRVLQEYRLSASELSKE